MKDMETHTDSVMETLINSFMLKKGVYSYERMDSWERINQKTLPTKITFHSNLTMENIIDLHCKYAEKI